MMQQMVVDYLKVWIQNITQLEINNYEEICLYGLVID